MKIYDETTKEELTEESCDLEKGYLYDGQMKTSHVDTKYEIMEDSISDLWPNGMQKEIPAHDVYEDCKYYHAYTEEEIAEREEIQKQEEAQRAADEEREANISRITEIDAQITYTAMMTNTLLSDDEDTDSTDESGDNTGDTTSNTDTSSDNKEVESDEQSNG